MVLQNITFLINPYPAEYFSWNNQLSISEPFIVSFRDIKMGTCTDMQPGLTLYWCQKLIYTNTNNYRFQ